MIGFVQNWLRRVFYISESADAFDTNSTIWIKRKLSFCLGGLWRAGFLLPELPYVG